MFKATLLIFILLFIGKTDNRIFLSSPLEIPLTLSANFGELRPGHFHSGVDFRTNGVTGKRVLSVANGYIYRISVSPGGFGNAIYIRHENGYSSVYGHLDRFIPEIEEYVTRNQYKNKKFSVNLFPDNQIFVVNKGDLIGYSGNSGSSQGPHLHFEVRRSSNENPVDPLSFLNVADNIRPVLKTLYLYPLSTQSRVDGESDNKSYNLTGSKGNYRISSNKLIEVSGEFGVGITAWDFLSSSWNKCGVRSVKVSIDNKTIYKHSLDEFSFDETRYINSHIDYKEYVENRIYVQKAFLQPNNNLSIYDSVSRKGFIKIEDYNIHKISILVDDYHGNNSRIDFDVKRSDYPVISQTEESYTRIMPYGDINEFITHDLRVEFPKDSFYDTLYFNYSKVPGSDKYLADIHSIHNNTFPVHKFFNLSIKPSTSDTLLLSKAGIVSIYMDRASFIGGDMKDGYISARVRDLGNYSIAIDTVPPDIRTINFKDGSNLSGRDELRIAVDDDFSGISIYEGSIDGEWALFEWDPKNDLLIYKFKKGRLKSGTDHKLTLSVTDARDNNTTISRRFFW